jgi:hypothetical protein
MLNHTKPEEILRCLDCLKGSQKNSGSNFSCREAARKYKLIS